ncbi:MAG: 23S rRNA (uracil(1939)-C(5))-methyltransferase RlmD [Christensenellales bacterium]|jgi:23S rRNA (uracil1939-C5)-methyltransferase
MKEIVRITGAGSEMQGVARLQDGRCAFVPRALPGESAEIEIARDMGRYVLSRTVRILEKSPERREPACPYYDICGGCSAQHMTYGLSLRLKRQRVFDALERIGGIANPHLQDTVGMENPYRSRRKAEYLVRGEKIGCARAGSREIVEIDDCLLQHPESVRVLRAVRSFLQAHSIPELRFVVTRVNARAECMVVLSFEGKHFDMRLAQSLAGAIARDCESVVSVFFCRLRAGYAHALDGACERRIGARVIHDGLLGVSFVLSPQSFFQVNPPQAERLFSVAGDMAQLSGKETLVDVYCGAGAIALTLAKRAARVYGIEIVPEAIADANRNAKENGLSETCRFLTGDAGTVLPELVRKGVTPHVMTVDPPRKGLDSAVIETALSVLPERIVYISCNPATLARDIKKLCETGAYRYEHGTPVDMFPWTEHVETVVLLSRAKE